MPESNGHAAEAIRQEYSGGHCEGNDLNTAAGLQYIRKNLAQPGQ